MNLQNATLGIELGSTRIKAVLIDENHKPIASGSYSWKNRHEDGVWTYHLEDAVIGIRECYRSLRENVEKTYGKKRFPNMELCAKSGTAEVGTNQKPHAWFAGFLRNEEAPYAFVVLVENGGGGSRGGGFG